MNLDHVIVIYKKTYAPDDTGDLNTVLDKVAKVAAKVRPLSGSERNHADQVEDTAKYRFTVHQSSNYKAADVIIWRGESYNISFVSDNSGRERYMYIDAVRGVAD